MFASLARRLFPSCLASVLLLGACYSPAPAEEPASAATAQTLTCGWHQRPLWGVASCQMVMACPGTVVAPSTASCEQLDAAPNRDYCDEHDAVRVEAAGDYVLWQRDGESRPVQFGVWPCPQ